MVGTGKTVLRTSAKSAAASSSSSKSAAASSGSSEPAAASSGLEPAGWSEGTKPRPPSYPPPGRVPARGSVAISLSNPFEDSADSAACAPAPPPPPLPPPPPPPPHLPPPVPSAKADAPTQKRSPNAFEAALTKFRRLNAPQQSEDAQTLTQPFHAPTDAQILKATIDAQTQTQPVHAPTDAMTQTQPFHAPTDAMTQTVAIAKGDAQTQTVANHAAAKGDAQTQTAAIRFPDDEARIPEAKVELLDGCLGEMQQARQIMAHSLVQCSLGRGGVITCTLI